MSVIFDDIHITWDGNKYTIKGDDKVMMLLASVEEVITTPEIFIFAQNGKIPLVKLSMAYEKILNFVGVEITAAEVYAQVFSNLKNQQDIIEVTMTLVQMLIPKDQKIIEQAQKTGKSKPQRKRKTKGAK